MQKLLFLWLFMLLPIKVSAQGGSIGLDAQTKYVWRGMEMMVEDASPVLFPHMDYAYKGFAAYAMGGYSVNGKYAEVDLGVSYTWKEFSLGVNDYYYPSVTSPKDDYFDLGKHTGHWLEGILTWSSARIPISLSVSNFFAGADKNAEGKQAYSTYVELAGFMNVSTNGTLNLTVGAALNESCYNGYVHGPGICNVEFKYTYEIALKNERTLPLSVAYLVSPINKKAFVNLSTSLNF